MIPIIDPLKTKLSGLLRESAPNPLNQARLRYGTKQDIDTLIEGVKKLSRGSERQVLIDLTPFERLGRFSNLINGLASINRPRPVLMLMGEGILAQLKSQTERLLIPTLLLNQDGTFKEFIGGTKEDQRILQLLREQYKFGSTKDISLANFRLSLANETLTKLLRDYKCIETPSRRSDDSILVSGRYWRRMPNGMLISCFLNVKKFGQDCDVLTSLAYEVVLQLSQCFRRDIDCMAEFDIIVVPNNTALFLASTLQSIIEKPVVVIDRLGPIPAPNIPSYNLAKQLGLKRVILIEEVVATGSEVDRSVFFLGTLGAVVTKIITFFNLEVGMPMLAKQSQITSLCCPKQELRYVYRSK